MLDDRNDLVSDAVIVGEAQSLSELVMAPATQGALDVIDPAPAPEPKRLTREEDDFCLAVIEYGGNLGLAYRSIFGDEVRSAAAKARLLMVRPEIAARIHDLTESVKEAALISLGGHLVELAEIRDLAKAQANVKVALAAEQARGEAAGLYKGKTGGGGFGGDGNVNVGIVVQLGKHDVDL